MPVYSLKNYAGNLTSLPGSLAQNRLSIVDEAKPQSRDDS